jgi:hypothetical protein
MRNKSYMLKEIRTFRDLEDEKLRLRAETSRIEERMNSNYANIKEALSPANILKSIMAEISTKAPLISGIYAIGQQIFTRRRKKKKKGIQVDPHEEV